MRRGKRPSAKPFLPTGRSREEVPPPPLLPTFSEEQLKAAERDGYKKGFLEGTEEGRKQAESEQAAVDRKLAETVEKFAKPCRAALRRLPQDGAAASQDVPKVALAIARKVAGNALDENAYAVIEDMALRCCETMIGEPKITITVHESMGDTLQRKLEQVAQKLPPRPTSLSSAIPRCRPPIAASNGSTA